MKKLFAIAAMTATVLSMLVAGSSPAAAHDWWTYHGSDSVGIQDQHHGVTVCDYERDGHYVSAWVEFADGTRDESRDGGDPGCDYVYYLVPITAYWICEETKGCKGPYGP